MQPEVVRINKPLYGNYVYINAEVVNKAIRRGVMIQIVVPKGSAIVDPKQWKANGRVMKKVFKRPNDPMILYGGNVPLPAEKGIVQPKEDLQAKLFL